MTATAKKRLGSKAMEDEGRVQLPYSTSRERKTTLTKLSGLETELSGVKVPINRVIDMLVDVYAVQHLRQRRSISAGLRPAPAAQTGPESEKQ